MKTKHHTIAAAAMIAGTTISHAANRTLILLQENSSGSSYLEDILPPGPIRTAVDGLIDTFVESSESENFRHLATDVPLGQSSAPYQRFVNLSDELCTRANLLNALIAETRAGRTIDLAVLGHGSNEFLGLHDGDSLTGATGSPFTLVPIPGTFPTQFHIVNTFNPGTIRSLLTDARAREGSGFNFKLRLVHMCNCFGSTLNDDWLAIGAKTSVGSLHNDYIPEPMITKFWNGFVLNDQRVQQAASDAFSFASNSISLLVPEIQTPDPETGLSMVQDSQPVALGNINLIFKDEFQMAVGETRTVPVLANKTHTFPIYISAGQRYTYSASTTDKWTNLFGAVNVNANGSAPGPFDGGRRLQSAGMMTLSGEFFTHPDGLNPFNFIGGSGFKIGTNLTTTSSRNGFLNLFANDNIVAYGDNGGSVAVTIRRVQ